MKTFLSFNLLLLFLLFLFSSCEKKMDLSINSNTIEHYKKASRMAFSTGLGVGSYPNCPPGAGGCATPVIPTPWSTYWKAVSYVDEEATEQVVAGIEILNRKTIRYHLLYQGQNYVNAGLETGGLFDIIEYGLLLPKTTAESLGVNSITLLGGEYEIQNSKDKIWSGYVDIKARIR